MTDTCHSMPLPGLNPPQPLSVFISPAINGHGGVRLLKRRLRKARYWGKDVLTDELSEFLCDHPELLILALVTTSALKLVYHPQPSLKDHFFLGISGSPEFHGLPLSCRLSFSGTKAEGCHHFSRKRMHLKLGVSLRPLRSASGLQFQPYLRERGNFRHRGSDTLTRCNDTLFRCSDTVSTPLSLLSHVRLLPFLRDNAPNQRHEEAVQDTG